MKERKDTHTHTKSGIFSELLRLLKNQRIMTTYYREMMQINKIILQVTALESRCLIRNRCNPWSYWNANARERCL